MLRQNRSLQTSPTSVTVDASGYYFQPYTEGVLFSVLILLWQGYQSRSNYRLSLATEKIMENIYWLIGTHGALRIIIDCRLNDPRGNWGIALEA